MIVALIDNGSLEAAAHRNLRAVASALSARVGVEVCAVSWKHSDRVRPELLDGVPAATLKPWLGTQLARGERDFVFVPFFISAQGAIGSALRADIEALQRDTTAFNFVFADGLAARGAIAKIVAARVRATLAAHHLTQPSVVIVDHGGPAPVSAILRNALALEIQRELGAAIGSLVAASMEGAEHAHNHPLLADVLTAAPCNRGDVVIAPLFLAPGRHAGPQGDLAEIARAAEDRATAELRCHFTELVGTHPGVIDALAGALHTTLFTLPAETLA